MNSNIKDVTRQCFRNWMVMMENWGNLSRNWGKRNSRWNWIHYKTRKKKSLDSFCPSDTLMAIPLKGTHINPKFPLVSWTLRRFKCPSEKLTHSAPPLDQWSGKAKVCGFDIWLIRIICLVFPTVLVCWYLAFSEKKKKGFYFFLKGKPTSCFLIC